MKKLFLILLLPNLILFANVKDILGAYQPHSQDLEKTEVSQKTSTSKRVFQDQVLCSDVIAPSVGPIFQDQHDFVIDAEFLYWYTGVTQLPYARKFKLTPLGDTTDPTAAVLTPVKFKHIDWSWDPGVRLGLGVVTDHDGWDFYANWTYTYNSVTDSSSVPDYRGRDFSTTIINPAGTEILTSPWIWLPHRDHFNRIKAKWSLLFNQIDLSIGRHYWLSPRLSVQPFAGLRGYWARMHFRVDAFRPFIDPPSFQNQIDSRSQFKQKSWAVGLLGGMNTTWHLTDHWSVFGMADIALSYGKYTVDRQIDNLQIQYGSFVPFRDVDFRTSDDIYRLQSFVDLSLGIRWETLIHQVYRLLFDLGWESHFLLNFSQIFVGTFQVGATANLPPPLQNASTDLPSSQGNLTLSGIVLRGRFEF